MATLNVTNLKNVGAGVVNVSLLADGTTTLVLNATGTNRLGGIRYNAGTLELYDGATWVAAGGGGGGVTGVSGTAPIVSSGGAAPAISITPATTSAAGSLSAADKVKIDALPATIVSSVTGTAPIVVATGTTTPAISINAATTSLPGSVQLANLAASQAGTSATLVSTPAFSVPKDAANMTGAAILPSGTTGQQPGVPVGGMLRMNTDYTPDYLEVYNAELSAWKRLAYEPDIVSVTDYTATNGSTLPTAGLFRNITIPAGVTCNVPSSCYLVATGTVTIDGTVNGVGTGLPGARGAYANNNTGFGNPYFNLQGSFGQGIGTGNNFNNAPLPGRAYGFYTSLAGSSGSSGDVFAEPGNQVAGSQGGYAGGTFIIKCLGVIQVGASAVINMAGGNSIAVTLGAGSWGASGGAGGGSGGLILLQSISSLTLAAGSTLNVSGGNGSNGVTTSGGASSISGGGGGGGGYIVLNSPSTSDSSTKVVNGGTGGSTVNSNFSDLFGGSGGGFGGEGGAGNANGSNGQTLFNTYI